MNDQKAVRKAPGKFLQTLSLILAFIVLFFCQLLSLPVKAVLDAIAQKQPALAADPVWITGTFYLEFIGWLLSVLLLLRLIKKDRPILKAMWTGAKGNNIKWLGTGLLVGFAMNALCILVAYLHGDIHLHFETFSPVPCLILLLCVAIQCTTEEIIDRGFLYQRLLKIYKKPWVAIIGNAVLFAAFHLANPGVTAGAMANIVLIGILLSMFVYYADSFWAACGIHTAWNFTQNIIFGLPNSGMVFPYSFFKLDAASARNSFAYSVGFGIEGTWTACLIIVMAGAVLFLLAKKHPVQPIDVWAEEKDAAV